MFAATSCNALDIRNNHGKRLVWRHKAEIRFQSRQKEETCSEHPQGIVVVLIIILNLHQWNASPKFSIQILLVPMGSESMQCLVEVETQSFEIKHLLPWSHHVVSHHVTLKWIRVPLTSKSLQFRVASLSSCKLTPKIRALRHFCQTILPFCHKRLNTEKDSRRSRRSRRVRTSISLPIKPCERAASSGTVEKHAKTAGGCFLTNS